MDEFLAHCWAGGVILCVLFCGWLLFGLLALIVTGEDPYKTESHATEVEAEAAEEEDIVPLPWLRKMYADGDKLYIDRHGVKTEIRHCPDFAETGCFYWVKTNS